MVATVDRRAATQKLSFHIFWVDFCGFEEYLIEIFNGYHPETQNERKVKSNFP